MDKTMYDILVYTPNDDKQNYNNCRLKVLVEKFGHQLIRIIKYKFIAKE